MLLKRAEIKIDPTSFVVLSTPDFSSEENVIIDQHIKANKTDLAETLKKIADIQSSHKQAVYEKEGVPDGSTAFDLEAEIRNHPDSLFVKCFAIKADEMNDNGDYFPKSELIIATDTFVGVPVFTNHQNTDINQARGKVVHSWWDEEKNGIMIIARVDAEAYPQLARGIKEKYVAATSMGAQVKYSICSVCHNFATAPPDYCEHIRERKTRTISAKKQKCCYHKNGKEDNCPICGSTKKEANVFDVHDQQVFEYNYGIKFIENSFVVNPACHDCGVTEVIDPAKFLAKVADLQEMLPGMIKRATETKVLCSDKECVHAASKEQSNAILEALDFLSKGADYIKKIAGQEQINDLNQALNLLTSVSQDMLKQKDQLDLEFLSDLVKVLADLQNVTDELTEQGYGRLPSPGQQGNVQQPEQAPVNNPSMNQQAAPQANPTGNASKIHTGPAGAAGTVTSPMAQKKLNLEKLSNNLLQKIKAMKQVNIPFLIEREINITPQKTLKFQFQIPKK